MPQPSRLEAEYQARKAAQKAGVDPDLFSRLVRQESDFDQSLVSPKGAIGLTQLMPATATELGVDPRDPNQNLEGGARYLGQQIQRFGGDPALGLAAYNAGAGRVQQYGGVPPFKETQDYVQRIVGGAAPAPVSTRIIIGTRLETEYQALKGRQAISPLVTEVNPPPAPGPAVGPRQSQRVAGLKVPGTLNLSNRPRVKNPDGSISTVRSMSVGFDEGEVLLPTVSEDGRIMSDQEAIQQYIASKEAGKPIHMGIFESPETATAYAKLVHEDQARGVDTATGRGITEPMPPGPRTGEQVLAGMETPAQQLMRQVGGSYAAGLGRAAVGGVPSLVGSLERQLGTIAPETYKAITGREVSEITPLEQLGQTIAGTEDRQGREAAPYRIGATIGGAIPSIVKWKVATAVALGATGINEIKEHLGLGPEHPLGQELWGLIAGFLPAVPAVQEYRQAIADPNVAETDKERLWDEFVRVQLPASLAIGLPIAAGMAKGGMEYLKRTGRPTAAAPIAAPEAAPIEAAPVARAGPEWQPVPEGEGATIEMVNAELAKIRAEKPTPEPEPTTPPTKAVAPPAALAVAPAPSVPIPLMSGKEDVVKTPLGDYRVRYELVDAAELRPSHDPFSFGRRKDYPATLQERPYHRDKSEQAKVVKAAGQYDPRFVISDAPDATNGPPILAGDSNVVLSGNSRVMARLRVGEGMARPGALEDYRAELETQAQRFGIDPAQARKMIAEGKDPVLVRRALEVRAEDQQAAAEAGRRFNMPFTQAVEPIAAAVARAKDMSPESINFIGEMLATAGEDASLRDALRKAPIQKEILGALQRDGIIPPTEMNRYVSPETGLLNDAGVDLVEKTLAASVVPDADLLSSAPKSQIAKIVKAAPALVQARVAGREWDIGALVTDALRFNVKRQAFMEQSGLPASEMFSQMDLYGAEKTPSVEVQRLAAVLRDATPTDFTKRMRLFASDSNRIVSGQKMLLDMMPGLKKIAETRDEAFESIVADVSSDAVHEPRKAYTTDPNQLKLEFIYDQAETRPGTTPEQRGLGLAALRALFVRDRNAGATLLGSNLWRDFTERQGADLVGQTARNPHELALLAQILRDPRYETMRFFFMKNGVIVEHTALTSRLPGTVTFARSRKLIAQMSKAKGMLAKERANTAMAAHQAVQIYGLSEMMRKLEADGYYILHNHPSGDSHPSVDFDIPFTQRLARDLPGFRGHVVIDKGEYSSFDSKGTVTRGVIQEPRFPEMEHDALGKPINNTAELVAVGKSLEAKEGMTVVISTDSAGKVKALAEMPTQLLTEQKGRAMVRLRKFVRWTGGRRAFAVTEKESSDLDYLIAAGILTDAVHGESGRARVSERSVVRGKERGYLSASMRAMEEGKPYEVSPLGFYSNIGKALESWQAKGTADQLRAHLKKFSGTSEEAKWTGLDDFLEGKKVVSRAEVEDFMRENQVEVKEVVRTGQSVSAKTGEQLGTKFSQWQTPGGENYRELVLTLPEVRGASQPGFETGRLFTGGHFDEPNPVAHIRFNDRTDADGKRVLFIEEIQSDWAQKGRRKGFGETQPPVTEQELNRLGTEALRALQANDLLGFDRASQALTAIRDHPDWRDRWQIASNEQAAALDAYRQAANARADWVKAVPRVPSAPFVTNTEHWTRLALARMLRYAAENGYDKIAWTTGEMQAARYDLSKQVDSIGYERMGEGSTRIAIRKGGETLDLRTLPNTDLADFIGKDVSKKILESGTVTGTLSGLDLKVGGEGMKAFYDQILPATANKLAKKWGGRVGEARIGTENTGPLIPDEAGGVVRSPGVGVVRQTVPALDITPEMRRGAMEGFSLFEQGRPYEAGGPPESPAEALDALRRHTRAVKVTTATKPNVLRRIQAAHKEFAPLGRIEKELRRLAGLPKAAFNLASRMELVAGARAKAKADWSRFYEAVVTPLVADIPLQDRIRRGQKFRDRLGQFHDYLTAERIKSRLRDDPEVKRVAGWTEAMADSALQGLTEEVGIQRMRMFEDLGKEYQRQADDALRLQVTAGKLSQEQYDAIKLHNDFYAPFKILKYIEEVNAPGGEGRRIATKAELTKRIVGITDEDFGIVNVVDTLGQQIVRSRILAEKNLAMLEVDKLADIDPDGRYVKRVSEVRVSAHKAVLPAPREGYDILNYTKDGEPAHLEVAHEVAKAVQGLDRRTIGPVMSGLSTAMQLGRFTAVGASIRFMVRNIVTDPVRMAVMSRYGVQNPVDLVRMPFDMLHGLYVSARGNMGVPDPRYLEFLDAGIGGSTFWTWVSDSPVQVNSLLYRRGIGAVKAARGVLDTTAKIGNILEETTKVAAFRRGKRIEGLESLTGEERAQKLQQIASEVRQFGGSPDFWKGGSFSRDMSILSMFYNARVQGVTSDLARFGGVHGARAAAGAWTRAGVLIGIPTTLLYLLNRSDEYKDDYDRIDSRDKDNYSHIPRESWFINEDGENVRDYWRIPKKDTSKLYSNILEMGLKFLEERDPEAFANLSSQMLEELSPISTQGKDWQERGESLLFGGANPVIKAGYEAFSGRDPYRHREIIPESMQGATDKSLQVRPTTPQVYRDIAAISPVPVSPLMVEKLSKTIGGSAVTQFIPRPGGVPGRPLARNPITSPFVRSEFTAKEDAWGRIKEGQGREVNERLRAKNVASQTWERVKDAPPAVQARAIRDLYRADKHAAEQLMEIRKDTAAGLTSIDRALKARGVESGERARFIADELDKLPDEQSRKEYIQSMYRKRILTDTVMGQVNRLRKMRLAQ